MNNSEAEQSKSRNPLFGLLAYSGLVFIFITTSILWLTAIKRRESL